MSRDPHKFYPPPPPKRSSKRKCPFGPISRRRKTQREDREEPPQEPQPTTQNLPHNQQVSHEPYQRTHDTTSAFRVMLMPSGPSNRSPFDHYKTTAKEEPRRKPPSRAINSSPVLTKQELQARIIREINEEIRIDCAERHLNSFALPNINGEEPPPRILTKEECLSLFNVTGFPTSGSFLGVYRWAADLGHARYNFVRELDEHEYHLLNAYD